MKFIDREHELFFVSKLKEMFKYRNPDVYYQSLIYTLGICETTRNNFKDIFDVENGNINLDSINSAWQTDISQKVTRIAFNLWNGCMYDSQKKFKSGKVSPKYSIAEIFRCPYAPYLYESIKLRYPEYTKEQYKKKEIKEMER